MTDTTPQPHEPPEAYKHRPEAPFEDNLADWFRAAYGEENVEQQQYQRPVRWYCDVVVELPFATLYIETESRPGEVRPGVAQALGYAADDLQRGVPVVVCPAGHLPAAERLRRLRQSGTVLIRAFDAEHGVFVENEQEEPTRYTDADLD